MVPASLWLVLYVDAAALQVGLYFFNRRHNVSPHEDEGSAGLSGMLISALSAPIYAASLMAAVLRRKGGFVITPKGDAQTRDGLITFRKHLLGGAPSLACRWHSRSCSGMNTLPCAHGRLPRSPSACCRWASGAWSAPRARAPLVSPW